MLLPKNICPLASLACDNEARFQLTGVYLERKDGAPCATVTDGKVLAHYTWAEPNWKDYPSNGTNPEPRAEGFEAIIPRGAWKTIDKMIPKKPARPILEYAVLQENDGLEPVEISATDLDRTSHETVRPVEGSYPDYGIVLRELATKWEVEAEVTIDARRLLQLADCIVKMSGTKRDEMVPVKLRLRGADKPVEIVREAPEGASKLQAIAMPIVVPKSS